MSGPLRAFDRLVVGLLGLLLVAGGLGVAELRLQLFGDWPSVLSAPAATTVLGSTWGPWAVAGATVVLALLALWWLWAHVARRAEDTVRLAGSDPTGRLEADLPALADVVADQVEQRGRLRKVTVNTRNEGYFSLIEVDARLRREGEVAPVVDAAEQLRSELEAAFPDDAVTGRIMVDASTRRRPRNERRPEVLEAEAGPDHAQQQRDAESANAALGPAATPPRELTAGSSATSSFSSSSTAASSGSSGSASTTGRAPSS